MAYIGYVIVIILIALGIWKKQSRVVTWLFAFFMWAILALNIGSADYAIYEIMYLNCFAPDFSLHEPGYMLLCKLFFVLGFSFRQFRMVISVFISLMTVKSMSYYTKNINFALALYILFPFCSAASGIRGAFAGAIVLFAIHFLFQNGKRSVIKYIITILIATLFHYTSVFYLIFLIAKIKKINVFVLFGCVAAAVPLGILLAQFNVLYTVASWFTSSTKILNWLAPSPELCFSKLYAASFLLAAYIIFLMYRSQMFLKDGEKIQLLGKDDILLMTKLFILCLLSFAGAIFKSVVFLRLLIGLCPLYFAVLSQSLAPLETDTLMVKKEKAFWRFTLPCFCFVVLLFVFGFWIGGDAIQNYKNNLLYSWL